MGICILSLKGSCLFKSFSEEEMLFKYFKTAYIKTNDTLNFKWMTFYSIRNIFLFATHYQVHTEIIKLFHTNCWDAHWRWLEANLVDRIQAAKASGSCNGLMTGASVTGLLTNFSSLSSVLGKSNKIHNKAITTWLVLQNSGSQPLWDHGPVNYFFMRRGSSIIDARAPNWAVAQQLRNTALEREFNGWYKYVNE